MIGEQHEKGNENAESHLNCLKNLNYGKEKKNDVDDEKSIFTFSQQSRICNR